MYKGVFLCFLLCFPFLLIGQDGTPGDWITMNIDMTDSMTTYNLGYDIKSKLESKVLSIVSRNGNACKISCVKNTNFNPDKLNLGDLSAGILCKPKLEVFEEEILETGMEKLTYVKLSLSIFIQSVKGNVIFASITRDYAGTGKDKKQAINNGITSILVKDPLYTQFLTDSRREIVRYYDQMCGTILDQATQLAKFRSHIEAIYLLWPMPREVKCYKEARLILDSVYVDYVNYKCVNNIYDAKVFVSNNQFSKALEQLLKIDGQSSCAKEALELMDKIATKVDLNEKERRELEKFKFMKENEIEMERERNRQMSVIVVGSSTPNQQ